MDYTQFDGIAKKFDPVRLVVDDLGYEFAKLAHRRGLEQSYQATLEEASRDVDESRAHFVLGVKELAIDTAIHEAGLHAERITGIVEGIAASNNAYLEGLGHKLKERSSLARKVDNEIGAYVTGDQVSIEAVRIVAGSIHDNLRFTMILRTGTFVDDYMAIEEALRTAGMSFACVKNTFDNDKDTYRGINTFLVDSESGYMFEMQFHTAQSFTAKSDSHAYYEVERDPENHTPEEVAEAFAKQRRIFSRDNIRVPEGVGAIANFRNAK